MAKQIFTAQTAAGSSEEFINRDPVAQRIDQDDAVCHVWVTGTFDTAQIDVEAEAPDNEWVSTPIATITEPGLYPIDLPSANLRLTLSSPGTANVNAWVEDYYRGIS